MGMLSAILIRLDGWHHCRQHPEEFMDAIESGFNPSTGKQVNSQVRIILYTQFFFNLIKSPYLYSITLGYNSKHKENNFIRGKDGNIYGNVKCNFN